MTHASTLHSPARLKEQEYLAGWQRARAELDNFRKRMFEEQSSQQQRTRQEVVTSLLELADNFQSMANHLPDELAGHSWTQGVMHIARQLQNLLHDYGVTPINTVGDQFNPSQHEAISHTKTPKIKSGRITKVVRVGYKMGDIVIRPAKVKVAK
ncbi:MAG: nucleotide exchange factor GrpE [bacterium]